MGVLCGWNMGVAFCAPFASSRAFLLRRGHGSWREPSTDVLHTYI